MIEPADPAQILAKAIDDVPLRVRVDQHSGAAHGCEQRSRRVLRRADGTGTDNARSGVPS